MEKAQLISQVSYAFVPEGARMITKDIGMGMQITPHTPGAVHIMEAQMLEQQLTAKLATLPRVLTVQNREAVRSAILDFFGGVMMSVTIPGIERTVEAQCETCLQKLSSLLPDIV